MLPVSVRIGAMALAVGAALYAPLPAKALGINFGPLHLNLPIPGFHGRRMARTEPGNPGSSGNPETADSGQPALLYPVLAWPSLYDDIFWPRPSAPWVFGYRNIFDQAFSKYPPERVADLCPYKVSADEVVMRIARETMPTAAQKPLLQKLGTALGQANGYLIKSCPTEVPQQPIDRLKLMDHQIDATIMALEIVRPALAEFVQSLDDKQRARLGGPAPSSDGNIVAVSCKLSAASVNDPLSRLEQAVQPTDAQRPAFAAVQDAFNRAGSEFDGTCGAVPSTALGRLDAAESRLDATWRAVQTIEVALANFQKQLSDEQNMRLNNLEIASAR